MALGVHALVLSAVLLAPTPGPREPEPPPIEVALVDPLTPPAPPALEPKPVQAAPETPAAAPKSPRLAPKPVKHVTARRTPPQRLVSAPQPSEVPPRFVPITPPETETQVSAAELAQATTAESEASGGAEDGAGASGAGDGLGGDGGGRCDMVAHLQRALRGDPRVRAAVVGAHRAPGFVGRPLVVWNGDWVRHGDEEGKGLASVRQAIAVEVAFAPKPCRAQAMHGLVVLSLNDGPGGARVVLGAGAWRWSDLLFAR